MINPLSDKQVREGVISYGLSSYGDDLRVADEFKIFTNVNCTVVDPKNFDERSLITCARRSAPNSFALARSVEYFKIPRDVLTICLGQSSYARCGILVTVTPFEPEWEGLVTLAISNTTPLPARIYAHEGLCQIRFFQSRRGLRNQLRRPQGQIPVTEGDCAAEVVGSREGNWLEPGAEETFEAQPLPSASEHSP